MLKDNKPLTYIALQEEAERAFKNWHETVENALVLSTVGFMFQSGFYYGAALVEKISGTRRNDELLETETHTSIGTYLPYEMLIDSTAAEIFTSGFIGGYCFSNGIVISDLTFY